MFCAITTRYLKHTDAKMRQNLYKLTKTFVKSGVVHQKCCLGKIRPVGPSMIRRWNILGCMFGR